ncbi:MAG: hypothetical protein JEZ06_10935 [Anaerolineaceae bacterium]|nr:hypothetical protein [Anaerolineaceae bacterium]
MNIRKPILIWIIVSLVVLIGLTLYFGFSNKSLLEENEQIKIENGVLAHRLSEVPATKVTPKETLETLIPTATQLSTMTAQPSQTPTFEVTATPRKLELLPDGFNSWCMPNDAAEPDIPVYQSGIVPENARLMIKEEEGNVLLIQVRSCTFAFTFNQPIHENIVFKMFDKSQFSFVDTVLIPVENNPQMGLVTVDHDFVIDPPFWQITYGISLSDFDSSNLYAGEIILKRGWFPGVCFGGVYPDPVTLECPKIGEAHPWDPWFGWDDPKINPDED